MIALRVCSLSGELATEGCKDAEVVGPESAVKRVTEAVTEPVSVAGAHERVQQTVAIGLLDPSLRLKNVRTAMVTVQIGLAPLERTLHGRPVHLRNLAPTLEAQAIPSTVDLTIRGNRTALGRVEVDDVVAYIDVGGLGPGQYTLNVHAEAAPEAGVTHVEPASVQVQIASVKR